jgi:O-acetylserine/cysteine efflux transporter
MNTNRRRAVAALTAAGLLWGTTVPLSKLALGWLAPGWLTFVRFGLAAAILLAAAPRARVRPACTPSVLASGAIGYGGSVVVQNAGIIRTSVSHAALLIGATPVLVAIIAALRHRTVARPVAWAGFAVSLAGAGVVAGGGGGSATAAGDGLVLASLLLSAAFTVAQARRLHGRDPVALTAAQFLGAALAVAPFSMATEGVPALPGGPGAVLAVLGLAAGGTLLPFTLFAYAQGRVSAEVAGAFLNLEPLVGAVAGVVVFGDPAGPVQLAGGVAILAGIALSSLPLLAAGRRGAAPRQPGLRQGTPRPQPRRGPRPSIARCRIARCRIPRCRIPRPRSPPSSILRCRIPLPRNALDGRPPRCRSGNGGSTATRTADRAVTRARPPGPRWPSRRASSGPRAPAGACGSGRRSTGGRPS